MMALLKEKALGMQMAASSGIRRLLSLASLVVGRTPPVVQLAHAGRKIIQRSNEGKQVVVAYDN